MEGTVDRFSRSREPEWNGNINRWSVTENRKNIPGKTVTGWNTNVLEFPSADSRRGSSGRRCAARGKWRSSTSTRNLDVTPSKV